MTAYAIFYVDEIQDMEQLKRYQRAAHPTLAQFGGQVIVAYGRQEPLEGTAMVGVVTVQFPTLQAASAWYHSEGYQAAKALRSTAASCRAVIVEGIA